MFDSCGSSFDTYLYLYRDDTTIWSWIAEGNDDGDCGTKEQLSISDIEAGAYILGVSGATTSDYGSYTFVIYCGSNLICGSEISGNTIAAYDVDYYRVTLSLPDIAMADEYSATNLIPAILINGCTGTNYDTKLYLFDTDYSELAQNDDSEHCPGGTSSNYSQLAVTDIAPGEYILKVAGSSSSFGAYGLSFECFHPYDVCINDATAAVALDGVYKFDHYDSKDVGLVHYNAAVNKYIYPYIWSSGIGRWYIHSNYSDTFVNAYCNIGSVGEQGYVFNLDDCIGEWTVWTSGWVTDPYMTVNNCQEVCSYGHYDASMDGVYFYDHFDITRRGAIYYCSFCNSGMYLYPMISVTKYYWMFGADYNELSWLSWCDVSALANSIGADYVFKLAHCANQWMSYNGTDSISWSIDTDICYATLSPTYSPSTAPSPAPTDATLSPSNAPSSPTYNPFPSPTSNPFLSPTSAAPTAKPTVTPTYNPTVAPTKNPTLAPIYNPTASPSDNPTVAPTYNPAVAPTNNPTSEPTKNPTLAPTYNPTASPSDNPTVAPIYNPAVPPTNNPTSAPTYNPTVAPTKNSTLAPTYNPTVAPTYIPTRSPTNNPTLSPTDYPTAPPTKNPTLSPTNDPIPSPTNNPITSPTNNPFASPTNNPFASTTENSSSSPTNNPISFQTNNPSAAPTGNPTVAPTYKPTVAPTKNPTISPSDNPTVAPTKNPVSGQANNPTYIPTQSPTNNPTLSPTNNPTLSPTDYPTAPPTKNSILSPTNDPFLSPTKNPTLLPTDNPISGQTNGPTNNPIATPTDDPTPVPTIVPSKTPITLQPTQCEENVNLQNEGCPDDGCENGVFLFATLSFSVCRKQAFIGNRYGLWNAIADCFCDVTDYSAGLQNRRRLKNRGNNNCDIRISKYEMMDLNDRISTECDQNGYRFSFVIEACAECTELTQYLYRINKMSKAEIIDAITSCSNWAATQQDKIGFEQIEDMEFDAIIRDDANKCDILTGNAQGKSSIAIIVIIMNLIIASLLYNGCL